MILQKLRLLQLAAATILALTITGCKTTETGVSPEAASMSASDLVALGDKADQEMRYARAVRYYQAAKDKDPRYPGIDDKLTTVKIMNGEIDEDTLGVLHSPGSAPVKLHSSRAAMQIFGQGDYVGAIEAFSEEIRLDSESWGSYRHLAECHYMRQDKRKCLAVVRQFETALANADRATLSDRDKSTITRIKMKFAGYEHGMSASKDSLKLEQYVKATARQQMVLGSRAERTSDYSAGIEHYAKAGELYPGLPDVWTRATWCAIKLKKWEEGLGYAKKAVANHPTDLISLLLYGDCLSELDDFEGANKYFYKIVKMDPNDWGAYARIIRIYLAMKDYPGCLEAIAQYEAALARSDRSILPRRELDRIVRLDKEFNGYKEKYAEYAK